MKILVNDVVYVYDQHRQILKMIQVQMQLVPLLKNSDVSISIYNERFTL